MTSPARPRVLLPAGGTLLAAALLATGAPALPAHAVDGRTVVSTGRDAAQPVYDLSSDATGTVFVTTGGAVRLVRAPMTPGSPEVDLGTRGPGDARLPAQEVSITGGRVAIPMLSADRDALATTVRWCLVADCPTTATFTAPAGYRYLGNAGDRAIVHNRSTNMLGLAPWSGGALTTVPLGSFPGPFGAYGDATGVVLWHGTRAAYVARPSMAVTPIAGRRAYLTPSYVVFSALAAGLDSYSIRRVPRATPGATPTVEATVATQGEEPARVVATDEAAAWAVPLLPPRSRKDTSDAVQSLVTLRFGDAPADSGRVEWSALTPFEDAAATFLAHRDDVLGRGFYAVAAGEQTGTAPRVHALPAEPARVTSVAVSHGRVVYSDDSEPEGAAYLRDVDGPVPGPETRLRTPASDVALSGPFVAVAHDDETTTVGAYSNETTYAGRVAERLKSFSRADDLDLSGRRLVSRNLGHDALSDVVAWTSTDRGNVTGAVFGDAFYAANPNGTVARRDLVTGAVRTVRAGTCGGSCGDDQRTWQVSAWGDEVVYALDLGAHGRVTGRWDATTGVTTALPMLDAGWTEVRYRDGLLVVYRAGAGVRLHDLRTGASAVVDPTGTLPSGNGLDDHYVAWVSAGGEAVVQPITDFLPAYESTPALLNAIVPAGFGPGIFGDTWRPEWILSEDVAWTLTLRRDDAAGAVARTFSGTSERGEVDLTWDGTDGDGDPAPQGWYHWTLAGPEPAATGRVFLSRDALPTPALTAPVLVSDVSADGRFRVSWSGAPGYAHYAVYRSRDGGTMTRVATTEATSMVVDARDQPFTYRFEVRVEDPAGRLSEPATATTVVPVDDPAGDPVNAGWARAYDGRHWRGSHARSTAAGAKYRFRVRGDGIWVVGARSPAYGRYRVTVDGRSWRYDAYSPTVRLRQVLFRLGGLSDTTHTVTVEVLATAGRTGVSVDGLAVRKPVVTEWGH